MYPLIRSRDDNVTKDVLTRWTGSAEKSTEYRVVVTGRNDGLVHIRHFVS